MKDSRVGRCGPCTGRKLVGRAKQSRSMVGRKRNQFQENNFIAGGWRGGDGRRLPRKIQLSRNR